MMCVEKIGNFFEFRVRSVEWTAGKLLLFYLQIVTQQDDEFFLSFDTIK